jgi:hypothetical protein
VAEFTDKECFDGVRRTAIWVPHGTWHEAVPVVRCYTLTSREFRDGRDLKDDCLNRITYYLTLDGGGVLR